MPEVEEEKIEFAKHGEAVTLEPFTHQVGLFKKYKIGLYLTCAYIGMNLSQI